MDSEASEAGAAFDPNELDGEQNYFFRNLLNKQIGSICVEGIARAGNAEQLWPLCEMPAIADKDYLRDNVNDGGGVFLLTVYSPTLSGGRRAKLGERRYTLPGPENWRALVPQLQEKDAAAAAATAPPLGFDSSQYGSPAPPAQPMTVPLDRPWVAPGMDPRDAQDSAERQRFDLQERSDRWRALEMAREDSQKAYNQSLRLVETLLKTQSANLNASANAPASAPAATPMLEVYKDRIDELRGERNELRARVRELENELAKAHADRDRLTLEAQELRARSQLSAREKELDLREARAEVSASAAASGDDGGDSPVGKIAGSVAEGAARGLAQGLAPALERMLPTLSKMLGGGGGAPGG